MSRPQTYCVRRAEWIRNMYRGINWRVRTIVEKYGSSAHLIPDTLLLADDLVYNHSAGDQAYCAASEVRNAVHRLVDEPLMAALQDINDAAAARCRHCQPDQPLRITSINGSGSSVEGLSDVIIGGRGTSDFDLMYEFDGPFSWAALGKREEPAVISSQSAPQLWARPTKNPGFVTLHWVKTTKCCHEKALEALPAHTMRSLMLNFSRGIRDGQISTAGPAVNVRTSDDPTDGGHDFVPCILVRGWWPAEDQLDGCHLEHDFPPAAVRDDIRNFGVHLVPTGRPGSDTEFIEFRISYSRAELVTVRHLASVIRAAIKALKDIKGVLRKNEVMSDEVKLKSYFIKTAGLWVAQTTPIGIWKGIADRVHKILDWLEENFTTGRLPCFFDHNIDVAAELSTKERQDIIDTIRLIREHATLLLMAVCEDPWPVDLLLEGGTEPLSERELRLRLARTLVRRAVAAGVGSRPTAPCWEYWWKQTIPPLLRTAPLLLQWYHYSDSGTHSQQCYLFMAWVVVDPADLVGGTVVTSPVSDTVTLDVTPLIQLLTRSDLEIMLDDPDRVATWCSQQLRRPLEERPAGLTAELDTPRGRAELLLRPELLLQAVRVNAPGKMDWWRRNDWRVKNDWMSNYRPMRSYQVIRVELEQFFNTNLHRQLHHKLPEMDAASVATTAGLWRRRLQQLLSGDRLRTAYDAVTGWWPDRWKMTPYCLAVDEADSEDSEQDDDDGDAGGEERRGPDEEQTAEGLPRPQREKWQQLERQHQQLWQELDRRGYEKKKTLNQQHDEECRSLERRHDKKWRIMEERHHDELKRLHQRHESATRCVELQNQEHSNQERRRRHLELLNRRKRRQSEQLERQHQIEWGDLAQKVQRQWDKMKRRHQSESQELKERYPNIWTGEELDRLMEECSRRRQQLGKELGKELEEELGKELEKEKEFKEEPRKRQEKDLELEEEEEESLVRGPKNHERQQKQQQHGQQQKQQQQQHQEGQRQGRQPSRNVEHLRNLIEVTRRHRQQRIQLQERHNQELEEQRRRHRQERKDLERRLGCRRDSRERRHRK
ncbi:uncharacterized protein LOC122378492 [Amphibalanus amphitrite]|uniref:uncharacterized protein LOC122378492 n=1 Tax=Amphibalanus amphitrite TaxID=1232801 RepID=UPI001C8FA7EE|nr:uncharacterized protein LOC122378492 [Amphibalanus amphitrite]